MSAISSNVKVKAIDSRKALAVEMLDMLARGKAADHWLRTFQHASLIAIVRNMFSAWDKHYVDDDVQCYRCAFGCWSEQEFTAAMVTVGAPSSEHHWLNYELRRLLLSSAYDRWTCSQSDAAPL